MSHTVDIRVAFDAPHLAVTDDHATLRLPTDGERGTARLSARPNRPGVVRDALLAVGDVLASDLRFKARDRADYLAYLVAKGKGVSKAVWDAQKEFLALQYSEAARSEEPLDPIVSVGRDAVRLEVLSRDESTWAQLALRRADAFATCEATEGTTHLDVTAPLLRDIAQLRTWRPTTIELAPASGEAVRRDRRVPLRWLRAFGQMQSAALLPAETFELAPIDVYNALHILRMRKAKKAPRALRYELVPGEAPRIVIEPWDLVLTGHGGPYRGAKPVVVRTWGRNRLAALARVLPHARSIRVHLLGAGLPAFYVVDLGDSTLTLGLSGWTDSGWAGIATFDLLAAERGSLGQTIRERLAAGAETVDGLATALGQPRGVVRQAALAELNALTIGVDVASGRLFDRPVVGRSLPDDALKFRDAREEQAHRLLAGKKQVSLTKVHDTPEGRTIEGRVDDAQAHRVFQPSFTIDGEGRTSGATCTCAAFRRSGVKEGPCEHMIAVRVLYAREQARLEAARGTEAGRKVIRAETRTLFRRTRAGTETYRISLDGRQVIARFGAGEPLRMQRMLFATEAAARSAYFHRLDELAARVWLDGGASE